MEIKCGCCIIKENKVLLLKLKSEGSQNGKWGPPGGGLIENESPIETAKREVLEETGLKVKISRLIQTTLSPTYKTGYCFVFYQAEIIGNATIKLQAEENSEYAWASEKEIKNNIYPLRKDFLKNVLLLSFKKETSVENEIVTVEI